MPLIRYFSIKANQRRENVSFRCETSNGFPQHFPESLLNARNHSQSLCWLAAGWVKECGRRYSAVTSSSPAPPGHLASVSPSEGAHHWSQRLGELREMLGTPLSQFKPEITNSQISDSFRPDTHMMGFFESCRGLNSLLL